MKLRKPFRKMDLVYTGINTQIRKQYPYRIKDVNINLNIKYIKYDSIKINTICMLCGKGPPQKKDYRMSCIFPSNLFCVLYICNSCGDELIKKGVEIR